MGFKTDKQRKGFFGNRGNNSSPSNIPMTNKPIPKSLDFIIREQMKTDKNAMKSLNIKKLNVTFETDRKEDIKIDKITKDNTKDSLLREVREFELEDEMKFILRRVNVKHPESMELEDYNKRPLAFALFTIDKIKLKERIKGK